MTEVVSLSRLNNLQSRIALILGNGTGDRGYGQPVTSQQLNRTNNPVVRAEDINRLFVDLIKARVHQVGYNSFINSEFKIFEVLQNTSAVGIESSPNVVVNQSTGQVTLVDDIENTVNYSQYRGIADYERLLGQIETDRFLIDSTQLSVEEGIQSVRTANWKNRVYHEFSVSFRSSDHRRHFFNAGGKINFNISFINPGNENSQSWEEFISDIGLITFSHSETIPATIGESIGNYDLTSEYRTIYNATGGFDNTLIIKAKELSSSSIAFIVEFIDSASDTESDNLIVGRLSSNINYVLPNGSFFYNTILYQTVVLNPPTFSTLVGLESFVSPLSVYSLFTSKSSIVKDDTFRITLNTINVIDNTSVPYTISGITSADILGQPLSDEFIVNSNRASKDFTAIDNIDEDKTFTLKLNNLPNQVNVIFNKTPITLPNDQTITCIAVINEASSMSIDALRSSWLAYRQRWPNRPYYLLQPTPGIVPSLGFPYSERRPGTLLTPTEFKQDPKAFGSYLISFDRFQAVSTTPTPIFVEGKGGGYFYTPQVWVPGEKGGMPSGYQTLDLYSDWYKICNLQEIPDGSTIAVMIDRSSSMSSVQQNYNFMYQQLQARNISVIYGTTKSENWPSFFARTLLPN